LTAGICELHGQTRRRGYRGNDRYARAEGLLHNLKRRAPAHKQRVSSKGQQLPQVSMADRLIHRIMPAYIFPYNDGVSGFGEDRSCMNAASPHEPRLSAFQALHPRGEGIRRDGEVIVDRGEVLVYILDAGLTANSAAR
jgi:hypothetical protein